MAEFRLSKWYLDCVTDAGEVSILYTGSVRWGALHLRYASELESTGGAITAHNHFGGAAEPKLNDGLLAWQSGAWQADAGELRATVFAADDGSVEWHCLMPRARARVGPLEGWGYVERLDLGISPWKLPLNTLRWGRFLCGAEWIVWIDWRGAYSRTLVYRSGEPVEVAAVADDRIDFADGSQLVMDRSLVLRAGPLGSTALAGVPGIRESMPGRLLRIVECKWRSRGRFARRGGPSVEGWALHERVEWPA